jgi:Sulfotransferase domain
VNNLSQDRVLRVAMWSGPRNISTALMRAWGNRADTVVVDEPLYPFYLAATGKNHPMAPEVIANGETDWRKVVVSLTMEIPRSGHKGSSNIRIFYQKQMAHHLLPEIEREWIAGLTNCFLIRDPAEVIASYIKKNPDPTLQDLGFAQQAEIFALVRQHSGRIPPVIDARDVLENPARILRLLCARLGVEFDPAMLKWAPGLRETDGVWAKHWYGEVASSTGFVPYRDRRAEVPERLREIEIRCRESYDLLYRHRLH